jgi:hypothetical protein
MIGTHLLIDVDSRIPNLALMQISSWLKGFGGTVEKVVEMHGRSRLLPYGDYAAVWVSAVFTWHRDLAEGVAKHYAEKGYDVRIGGTGVSLSTKLWPEIDASPPDYSLYGDDRAIGFVQRGCIRACSFCVVNKKEGWLRDNPYRPLETWVPDGFKKVCLLDNEFAACPREKEVLRTAKENGWRLSITQGYDLRRVTPEKAAMLADWKPMDIKFNEPRVYCAWDYFAVGPEILRGIQRLKDAGFRGREIMCYLLVGYCTSHFQDLYRFHTLWKGYGAYPYVMRYNMRSDDRFLNALARYANRGPAAYRNHSFPDYCQKYAPAVLMEAEDLWARCELGEHPPLKIPFQMMPMASLYGASA